MIKEIIELLNNNGVKAYDKYPTRPPLEFVVVKSNGIKSDANVMVHQFLIDIYSKNDIYLIQGNVSKVLLVDGTDLNFCGNPALNTGEVEQLTSKYKKLPLDFSLDKLKYT